MRYACSMVAFVDGGLPFDSLVVHHQSLDLFVWIVERIVGGFSRRLRSRSSASDLADAGTVGWMCRITAGRNEEATGHIHCFPDGLLGFVRQFLFRQLQRDIRRRLQRSVPSPLS